MLHLTPSPSSKPGSERRHDLRRQLRQPVKLHCPDTGRYLAGATANISSGGALLEIEHPSLLVPGQQVRLGITWNPRQNVLQQDDLLPATVVRSLGHGHRQSVAIAFTQAQSLPALAATA